MDDIDGGERAIIILDEGDGDGVRAGVGGIGEDVTTKFTYYNFFQPSHINLCRQRTNT